MRSQKGILIILIHADLLDYLRWSKCWVGSSATRIAAWIDIRRLCRDLGEQRSVPVVSRCLSWSLENHHELIWFNLPILLVFIIVYYILVCVVYIIMWYYVCVCLICLCTSIYWWSSCGSCSHVCCSLPCKVTVLSGERGNPWVVSLRKSGSYDRQGFLNEFYP